MEKNMSLRVEEINDIIRRAEAAESKAESEADFIEVAGLWRSLAERGSS
jgi:hypothetical protein